MVLNENLLPQHVEFNNTANGLKSVIKSVNYDRQGECSPEKFVDQ